MNTYLLKQSELKEVLRSFRHAYYAVGVFSFFINLLLLVPTIYMLQVYDRVLSSRNETTLLMLTIVVLGLYLLMGIIESVRSAVLIRISTKFSLAMASRIFDAIFEYSLRTKGAGNPSQAIHDLSSLRNFLGSAALIALFDLLWMPIFLVAAVLFDATLGIFLLAGMVTLSALAYATEALTSERMIKANALAIKASAQTNNSLRNAEVIESMGMLGALKGRWLASEQSILVLQGLASDRAAVINAVTRFARVSLQSLMLGLGAWLALQGKISPGMMIAATLLMGRALAPVEQAISVWKLFVSAREAYARLSDLLKECPKREIGMALPAPKGKLSVETASVAVPGTNTIVLRNINFSIEAGEVLGIIGPSASGKSSLARLLVGVWATHSGKIRLDGVDIHSWNKEELGPYLGYLPQDIELFDGTIAENIARFGEIDSEKIIGAARLAGVHDLILRLPKGYDSSIGAGGDALSGGQKQRVALARALYGLPSFVVLDEPNSNLDDAGEAALAQAIMGMKAQGKTVVLITHRSALLATTDKLLVLSEGAQQVFGPKDQVISALTSARQTRELANAPQR
ncbi:MAG: type I secretion system permease/ATPase [Nitrosomonadales bacterium]|nr:type I secretion system permease/ATPase [Nitrosomonadales bacterium]